MQTVDLLDAAVDDFVQFRAQAFEHFDVGFVDRALDIDRQRQQAPEKIKLFDIEAGFKFVRLL